MQASPNELRDARVLLTLVGGRIVHDGAAPSTLLPQREAGGTAPQTGSDWAEAAL